MLGSRDSESDSQYLGEMEDDNYQQPELQ
jgi:hypothetical protein